MTEYEYALVLLPPDERRDIERMAKQLVARMKADHPSVPMSYGAALEVLYKIGRRMNEK